jgi:hypothetical protein
MPHALKNAVHTCHGMPLVFPHAQNGEWDFAMDSLQLNLNSANSCHFAPTSIPFDNYDGAFGFQWSVPTYRSGFAVVVKVQADTQDIWAWAKVFSSDLWIVTILSSFGLGALIWISERDYQVSAQCVHSAAHMPVPAAVT